MTKSITRITQRWLINNQRMTATMMTQQDVIDSLPPHLRPFVAYQEYNRYTSRDHAVWRFLLHQLRDNLGHTAHPVYLAGLESTGISVEAIPRIEEINHSLTKIGWRAVVVDGFVPPAIFMEFQAHRVLAVAVDMRNIDHMLYTPAPDIVHESAGHAPFIIDTDYAEFLQRFGELGMRAVISLADLTVADAVRHLSIVKEAPCSTTEDIREAEQQLQEAMAANNETSEAAMMARLHWWTVEYGLVGPMDRYHIFGAGLLSSLGESQNCLDDRRVKKLPLTVDAVAMPYDITTEQPQLFVARNCRHLSQVLEVLGSRMCVNQGGSESIEKAIAAGTVNTAVTSAGVEISGVFSRVIKDAVGNVIYFNTIGPTQLAYQRRELPGHGTGYHATGFSSAIGRLVTMERCLSSYTIDELKQQGIDIDKPTTLDFLSGIRITGTLRYILRRHQKNLLFSFNDCIVTSTDGENLFKPDWGMFDLVLGEEIVSLYGGSADPEAYPVYNKSPMEATVAPQYDSATQARFAIYDRIRCAREREGMDPVAIQTLIEEAFEVADEEWLLCFELLELAVTHNLDKTVGDRLLTRLEALADNDERATLIAYGLKRLGIRHTAGGGAN